MKLTPYQWTLAFTAALATHAMATVLLPQTLSTHNSDPPPKPILVSLATPPEPVLPTPAVTPPAPVRPTPPVARQPESEPEAQPPQPVPAPSPIKPAPLTQQSIAAIHPTPVATPLAAPRTSTATVSNDNKTPTQESPANPTTAVAPTSVLDAVDLAQLQDKYGKDIGLILNKNKRYPRRAKYYGYEGTALVTFVVNRHGEVLSYSLKRSSGHSPLDKEALALIKRARHLPVFPDELAKVQDTITVTVPIKFQVP